MTPCVNDGENKKPMFETEDAEVQSISFGEYAGLMHLVANVAKNIHNVQQGKVPRMINSKGTWINCSSPSHPKLNVYFSVAVDGYKRINKQAPPAMRRRTAEVQDLADSGLPGVL